MKKAMKMKKEPAAKMKKAMKMKSPAKKSVDISKVKPGQQKLIQGIVKNATAMKAGAMKLKKESAMKMKKAGMMMKKSAAMMKKAMKMKKPMKMGHKKQ